MSGAWLSIVQGFAGMRTNNKILAFSPKLPKKWKGYSLNIKYKDNKLKVDINQNGIKITNSEGNDIEVNIYDEKYIIKNNEYVENKNLVFN